MQHISRALNEGDPRVLEKIAETVQRDPALLEAVIAGLTSNDHVIRRRAATAVERISRKRSAFLHSYRRLLIEHATSDEPEIRVPLIQLLPRLPMDDQERAALFEGLQPSLLDASDLLKIVCLQALVMFAENDPALRSQIITLLEEQAVIGIPANQTLANYSLARFSTSGVVMEGQQRPHISLRERWQRGSLMWSFGSQSMKAAMNHTRGLREQAQERERHGPPTKKTMLKELGNLLYGILALTICVVLAPQMIKILSHFPDAVSLIDYVSGALGLVAGIFGIWLFIVSARNLVKIGVRMYQLRRVREMGE